MLTYRLIRVAVSDKQTNSLKNKRIWLIFNPINQ